MKYQDFLRNHTNPESFLFTEKEILILIKNGLGLRLSSNPNEIIHGGLGDAVPLSYIGGAQDILDFVTLSCYLLTSTNLDENKRDNIHQQLTNIYRKYAEYPRSVSSNKRDLQYLPGLIITYAKLLDIGDLEEIPSSVKRLPEAEEATLLHIYNILDCSIMVLCLFDGRNTCGETPVLKQLLIDNFNRQLFYRLFFNRFFFDKNQMYYLLLLQRTNHFHNCYDLQRYPMGKAGNAKFMPENVQDSFSFVPFETSDSIVDHISGIFTWIKNNISKYQEKILPAENHPTPKTVINSKKESAGSCSNFTKVLVTIGFFASVTAVSVGVFLNNTYNKPG